MTTHTPPDTSASRKLSNELATNILPHLNGRVGFDRVTVAPSSPIIFDIRPFACPDYCQVIADKAGLKHIEKSTDTALNIDYYLTLKVKDMAITSAAFNINSLLAGHNAIIHTDPVDIAIAIARASHIASKFFKAIDCDYHDQLIPGQCDPHEKTTSARFTKAEISIDVADKDGTFARAATLCQQSKLGLATLINGKKEGSTISWKQQQSKLTIYDKPQQSDDMLNKIIEGDQTTRIELTLKGDKLNAAMGWDKGGINRPRYLCTKHAEVIMAEHIANFSGLFQQPGCENKLPTSRYKHYDKLMNAIDLIDCGNGLRLKARLDEWKRNPKQIKPRDFKKLVEHIKEYQLSKGILEDLAILAITPPPINVYNTYNGKPYANPIPESSLEACHDTLAFQKKAMAASEVNHQVKVEENTEYTTPPAPRWNTDSQADTTHPKISSIEAIDPQHHRPAKISTTQSPKVTYQDSDGAVFHMTEDVTIISVEDVIEALSNRTGYEMNPHFADEMLAQEYQTIALFDDSLTNYSMNTAVETTSLKATYLKKVPQCYRPGPQEVDYTDIDQSEWHHDSSLN